MDDKRKRLKAYYKQSREIFAEWEERGYRYPPPRSVPMPEYLRGMMCEARTKATGNPCKQKATYANGRCKLHGGLSTGPRTSAGKKKSAQNGFKKKVST
jgi:hypothetical protein